MPLHQRRHRMHRTEAHLRRVQACPFTVDDAPEHREIVAPDRLFGGQQQHGRAIGDLRTVTGRHPTDRTIEDRAKFRQRLYR